MAVVVGKVFVSVWQGVADDLWEMRLQLAEEAFSGFVVVGTHVQAYVGQSCP